MTQEETARKKEEAYRLLGQGMRQCEIRIVTGLSRSTVCKVAKKYREEHGIETAKREKTIKEIVFERTAAGQSPGQIIQETGINPQTVRNYASRYRKEHPAEHIARDNTDSIWCRSCRYRPNERLKWHKCNYIEITGHSRGCPAARCDKYERGAPAGHTPQSRSLTKIRWS